MKWIWLLVLSVAACDSPRLTPPEPQAPVCTTGIVLQLPARPKFDVLFVVDDSPAMAAMEARLAAQLPLFMDTLVDPTTKELPNLHLGVVSSSIGAGRFPNVPGCEPGGPGDGGGRLLHPAAAGLTGDEAFIRTNVAPLNLTLPLRDTFAGLARLGHGGCRFPQPLAAARRALEKARDPGDPDNAGFLRQDASLMVLFITNGDDCSVPANSDLFDPAQTQLSDPYGALTPYRCAEFGLTCAGTRLPHTVPSTNALPLDACAPDSPVGLLTPVSTFDAWLRTLKANPDDILVSLIGGPTTQVSLQGKAASLPDGTVEIHPELAPSCSADTTDDTATPSVRLRALVDTFGSNGVFYPACAAPLSRVLVSLTESVRIRFEPNCLSTAIIDRPDGQPACTASQTATDERGDVSRTDVPLCDADRTVVPCWEAITTWCVPPGTKQPRICRNHACTFELPDAATTVRIECQVDCASPAAGTTRR